jgi:hypothetical protein
MMTDREWEIDAFLLGDPVIDRQAFEQRMLDDPDFALQVASAAEVFELVALAASEISPVEAVGAASVVGSAPLQVSSSTTGWKIALAIAATLLVGVFASLNWFRNAQRGVDETVANSWLALQQERAASDRGALPDNTSDPEMEIVSVSNLDDQDWLIDSAIAFYSESEL